MNHTASYDAVVVGSGPNGLGAAITLAEAGQRVVVLEANETAGGGVRSLPLTEPGFVHDFGAAVFPFGMGSPFFRRLPLERYGLRWVHPDLPLAHPLDGGRAALMYPSLGETAEHLGHDGARYRRLLGPTVRAWPKLAEEILGPVLHVPRHLVTLARFGLPALLPASAVAALFRTEEARALWAGCAAHAALPFSDIASAAVGLVLMGVGHRAGWPVPEGGAQSITNALVAHLEALGGEVACGERVEAWEDLPHAKAVLMDTAPETLLRVAGDRLPASYQTAVHRFERGPSAFKLDYALDGPVPWANADVARAATVHLGGTFEEIAEAEAAVADGIVHPRPYVLLAQPTLFDPTRAPEGKHTLWAYGHLPFGSSVDYADEIEAQIERFAPGFRDRMIARHAMAPADLERRNANLVGGDIFGGSQHLGQVVARPRLRPQPYRTGAPGLYLCSASTPPGAGVHGMCGVRAAQVALRDVFA
ncbi:MAG: NAD(P)/FAD-dependent oxidoreductase [Bacteroidota bacterium]